MRNIPCFPFQGNSSAAETLLLCLAILADGHNEQIAFHPPVLVIPLTMRLFQDGNTAQLKRPFEDRLGITQRLIFDGAGQGCTKVFGTDVAREHLAVEGGNQNIDRADVFLAVSHEHTTLLRGGIQSDLSRGRAHMLLCLSILCLQVSALTLAAVLSSCADEHLTPALRAPDAMRHHQVDRGCSCVSSLGTSINGTTYFVNISLPPYRATTSNAHSSPAQIRRGLSGPLSVIKKTKVHRLLQLIDIVGSKQYSRCMGLHKRDLSITRQSKWKRVRAL
jgi:hypothetical protein